MTNTQLYLVLGIPSLLILLSWMSTFLQNFRLDGKIESLRAELATEFQAVRCDINTVTRLYGEPI